MTTALIAAELESVTVHADHLVLQLTGDRPPLSPPLTHQLRSTAAERSFVPQGREGGDRLRPDEDGGSHPHPREHSHRPKLDGRSRGRAKRGHRHDCKGGNSAASARCV